MRGGAPAMFAFAALLALFGAINAVWSGDGFQIALTGFAVLVVATSGVLAIFTGRRRGPVALPRRSAPAAVAGLSVVLMLFGLVWATFLIWAGAVLLIAALARIGGELSAQHRAEQRFR